MYAISIGLNFTVWIAKLSIDFTFSRSFSCLPILLQWASGSLLTFQCVPLVGCWRGQGGRSKWQPGQKCSLSKVLEDHTMDDPQGSLRSLRLSMLFSYFSDLPCWITSNNMICEWSVRFFIVSNGKLLQIAIKHRDLQYLLLNWIELKEDTVSSWTRGLPWRRSSPRHDDGRYQDNRSASLGTPVASATQRPVTLNLNIALL